MSHHSLMYPEDVLLQSYYHPPVYPSHSLLNKRHSIYNNHKAYQSAVHQDKQYRSFSLGTQPHSLGYFYGRDVRTSSSEVNTPKNQPRALAKRMDDIMASGGRSIREEILMEKLEKQTKRQRINTCHKKQYLLQLENSFGSINNDSFYSAYANNPEPHYHKYASKGKMSTALKNEK